MLLAPIVWVLTVVICYFFAAKVWWFPPPINQHGIAYDDQFMRTLVVTGIIFFLAQFALGWAIFRFRDKGGKARYSHGNNKWEVVWTSATAILFVGIVLMGTRIWAAVHLAEPDPNAMPIELMSKQFAFSFRYPGVDGRFGRTDLKLVNDAAGNPFGLDDKDPAAKDDITSASLKVPVGKPIKLIMHSRDVIHNFFVRELRLKQDIVPGMEIPLYFQEGIASADVSRELLLELLGLGAGRDPSGAQRIDYFALFGGTDCGSMEWNLTHY